MPQVEEPRIELIDATTALLEAAPDAAQFSALLDGAAIAASSSFCTASSLTASAV